MPAVSAKSISSMTSLLVDDPTMSSILALPGLVDFQVTADWQTGSTGQITVTNTGTTTTDGWQIAINTPSAMTASWNGVVTSPVDGQYIVTNAAWNGQLAPGASATFGFNLDQSGSAAAVDVQLLALGDAGSTVSPALTPDPAVIPVAPTDPTLDGASTTPVITPAASASPLTQAVDDAASGPTAATPTDLPAATIDPTPAAATPASNDTAAPDASTLPGVAALDIAADWQSGFTGQVTVTNNGATATTGWQIEIDTPGTMTASWNGVVASHADGKYVITNAAWNGRLAPGASETFGFNLDRGVTTSPTTVHLLALGASPAAATPIPTQDPAPASVAPLDPNLDSTVATPVGAPAPDSPVPDSSTPDSSAPLASTPLDDAASGPTPTTGSDPQPATTSPTDDATVASAPSLPGAATFDIAADWQSGFTGQVTVTNNGPTATTGWQIEIDTPGTLTASWNGAVASHTDGKYVISNAAWNGRLAPGASEMFGFNLNRAATGPDTSVHLLALSGSVPAAASAPALQAANVVVQETASGSTQATFDVHLSAASASPVTVQYATVDGTALAGRDYDAGAGTLTFAPGQTDATVAVNTYANSPGSDLLFSLGLANPVGATLASSAATAELITAAAPAPVQNGLFVNVSEDAYLGDAHFTVSVDGVQEGGIYAATASHADGSTGSVAIAGSFGAGPHSVSIAVVDDSGLAAGNNLYVDSVTYGGVTQAVGSELSTLGASTSVTVGAAAASVSQTAAAAPGSFQYLGVNLSGAEFGINDPTDGTVNIGTYGTDYTYPTHAELDYYASEGLNVVRLPFSWERLQPVENGPLDKTQLGYIDDVVQYAASKGITVDLDPHNYGYGYGNLIGSAGTPDSAFSNLWSQLASHFAGQSNVIFGLMNEPHVQTPSQWVAPVNDAIAAIRATGATQEILVPGTDWTGGQSWDTSGNAQIFASNVVDPGHNMAFEIHQYSNDDGSGSTTDVVSPTIAADRLMDVTQWAEQTGNKLFLGEFGAGSDPASLTNLTNMLDYMQQHTDAWQGGTEWGGGPWWGNYGFGLDPHNGVTTPQVATLASFAPKAGM